MYKSILTYNNLSGRITPVLNIENKELSKQLENENALNLSES